jgi:iron complex outermembrane receptor protein
MFGAGGHKNGKHIPYYVCSKRFNEHECDQDYVRATALWRSTRDDYRLFMDPLYENRHESRIAAVTAEGRQGVAGPVSMNWRMSGESEALDSVRLGDHNRERGDLLLLPELALGRTRVYAGAKGCVFSGESSDVLPQAGVRIAVADTHSLFASYTESVRQPSYTELNYESPGSLGNSGLRRQEAQNVEAGWRWDPAPNRWCRMTLFGTRSRYTVDWVKELAASPRWVATDLGTVDTGGFEFAGRYRVSERFDVQSDYTWLTKQHDGDYYAGRYVLDYPSHMLRVTGEWRATASNSALFTQTFRRQAPAGARREDDVGVDGRLAILCCPPKCDGLEVTLACDNVWDDDTPVFPDLPVPGRRVSLSIAWAWK